MAYVFDPEILGGCVKQGLDMPLEDALDAITAALKTAYPDHIDDGPRHWMFNNAGGAMGQMCLLHASLTEYVLFFGSPIGTEGHSGRYRTEVYDWMFDGEMWTYHEGDTQRTVYKPGSKAFLGSSKVKGYRLPERGWMLEYSRGFIPGMLPFGLADTMMSTLDFKTLARTIGRYAQLTTRSLFKGKL